MQHNIDTLAAHVDHLRESQLHREKSIIRLTGSSRGPAFQILNLPGFEYFMGAIILFNLVVMIIEVDLSASEDEEESGIHWTVVFGWVVLSIFIFELVLRLIAFQRAFWKDPWDIADFVIVVTDVVFTIIGLIGGDVFPVSILRVFRLSKLARVSKLVRVLPELRMLLAGLVHSLRATFWGVLLLGLFLLVWSMLGVLIINPLNKDIDYGADCDRCSRAYSSVMQAALTFFLQFIIGEEWDISVRIIEKHPMSTLFFAPAFFSVGLSLMNLMLSVVVNAAQRAYDQEAEEEAAEHALLKEKKQDHILRLCQDIDTDHSGTLSHDEIYAGFMEPGEFHDIVTEIGFSAEDFEEAWRIIDIEDTGVVTYKELINFLFTMKSSTAHFTLQYIKHYVTWIKNASLKQLLQQAKEELFMEHKLQESMSTVEKEEQDILASEQRIEKFLDRVEKEEGSLQAKLDRDVKVKPRSPAQEEDPRAAAVEKQPQPQAPPAVSEAIQDLEKQPQPQAPPAVSEAIQDLVKQVDNHVERMHIELKDILFDMRSTPGKQNHSLDLKLRNTLDSSATHGSRKDKVLSSKIWSSPSVRQHNMASNSSRWQECNLQDLEFGGAAPHPQGEAE